MRGARWKSAWAAAARGAEREVVEERAGSGRPARGEGVRWKDARNAAGSSADHGAVVD